MKKILCNATALSVAVLSLFSYFPSAAFAAGETVSEPEPQIYTVQYGDPSESGLLEQYYVDSDGNRATFDLTPNYLRRASDLPSSFDLRDVDGVSYITSVKSQGSTGTCWAHAAMACAESNMIMQGLANVDTVDYSEAHLAWFGNCSYSTDTSDPLYHDGNNYGTDGYLYGGNDEIAAAVLARGSGVVSQSVTGSVASKPKLDESLRYQSEAYLEACDEIDITDRDAIKEHLMTTGAVSTGYYDDSQDDDVNYDAENHSYYCSDSTQQSNHAVTIVGWDDNFSNGRFSNGTPKNNGVWICKNSWGTSYGDNGYFYISYYDATLQDAVSYEMGDRSDYQDIYQYDGFAAATLNYGTSYGIAGANIFTAEKNESVTSVAFRTCDASVPYTIRVYKNVTAGKPTSGTLALTQSGTLTYAGYHILDLESAVNVTKGTNFSIVLILSQGGSYLQFDNNANASGQSFFTSVSKSGTPQTWKDTYGYTSSNGVELSANVCLKAFTMTGLTIDEENFPDANFRSYLSTNVDSGRKKDGILSDAEIAAAVSMDLSGLEIENLEGIENFRYLTILDISDNPILSADLSSNTALDTLIADGLGKSFASISCDTITGLGLDTTKLSDLSGAYIKDGTLVPTDSTITYTYDCGNGFTIAPTITASSIGHSFGEWTDNGDGTHSEICSVCGYTVTGTHEYGDWTANADGTHSRFCGICGSEESEAHSITAWTSNNDGTHSGQCAICCDVETENCTFGEYTDNGDGTHSCTCEVCGGTLTSAHNYGEWSDNGNGTHSRICEDCGHVETASCTYGEWSDNGNGTHSRTCEDCGHVETVSCTYGEWSDNGNGTHSRTCKNCGHVETASCTYGEWSDNGNGTHSRTCKDCGHVETASCTYGEWTDNGNGTHSRTCKNCGHVETASCTYGEWTDNGNGTHSRTCKNCGHVETASCTYGEWTDNGNGTHSRICEDCGHVETASCIYGEWTINMDGTRSRVCTVCGHVQTEKLEGIIKGDLTGDNKVSVFDLILMRRWITAATVDSVTALTCDFNNDQQFTVADLVAVSKFMSGC